MTLARPLSERFHEKVLKPDGDECWIWLGRRNVQGYGVTSIGHTGKILAHRLSWLLQVGPIPTGLCVLHHCDNPACVRPDHLFVGTQRENLADMVQKKRHFKPRGVQMPTAKLTAEQVVVIRRDYVPGIQHVKGSGNVRDLCVKFAVSANTIRAIGQRKAWRHV